MAEQALRLWISKDIKEDVSKWKLEEVWAFPVVNRI